MKNTFYVFTLSDRQTRLLREMNKVQRKHGAALILLGFAGILTGITLSSMLKQIDELTEKLNAQNTRETAE